MKRYYLFGIGLIVFFTVAVAGLFFRYDAVYGIAKAAANAADPLMDETAAPETFSWQGEAWQSIRTGNWEIYYSPFAKEPIQLTNHPAADTLPRLNVGSTKVAFVSDRNGNDEIYTIDIDGMNLTRLTTDGAKDTLPYWSPDGTQLVFSSQRSGNGDLYIMKTDGSAVRRITSDDAEDTYPSWSPDGTQLLWVRLYPIIDRRPQEGELWVANADGSNARPLTGRLHTPARPLISPNGAHIALDADLDQNGLTDIVLMDRNGANAFIYLPGDVGRLQWMGTWEPDSASFWITKLSYIVHLDGTWTLEFMDINRLCLDNRPGCDSLIPSDRQAINPDRQYADLQTPVSQVAPLPLYSRLSGFELHWFGKEYGPSGLVGFDIQYRREGEEAWQDFWRGTIRNPDILPETPNPEEGSQLFSAPDVGKYYFRSRTLDYAGNYESWPGNSTGDAATTIFSWYLSGQVTDGRGIPYIEEPIALQPTAIEPVVTDSRGEFQVHIGTPGDYMLAQEMALKMDQDRTRRYYRLPTDNIIQNGGFETPISTNDWQISGTVAMTKSVDLAHSGAKVAQLGASCPAPCLASVPGSNIADLDQQKLVFDPAGILHLFARKSPSTLIHQIRTPDGRWLPYVALANGVVNWSPAIVFDQNGDLHLAWSALGPPPGGEEDTLYYAHYRTGQGWSQPELLGLGATPQLAIDSKQRLHLLYRCANNEECQFFRMGYRIRNTGGSWSAPKILNTADLLTEYAMAAAGDTIHIAWVERNNLRGSERLWSATLASNGALLNRQQLDFGTAPTSGWNHFGMLHLLADQRRTLHLAWGVPNENRLYYTQHAANESWQPINSLYGGTENASLYPPVILLDQQNRLHLIIGTVGESHFAHWRRAADGQWLPVQSLDLYEGRDRTLMDAVFDAEDNLYFMMGDFELGFLIKQLATVTNAEQSQLRQTVVVPSTLHQPTLSFMYALNGEGNRGSMFHVAITEGISTTTVFSVAAESAWQLGWADMTPWQGKSVTITFQTSQAVGDQYLQAALDRVALGSWRRPLPQAFSPTAMEWGVSATLVLTGANFIATPRIYVGERLLSNVVQIDVNMLTVPLPADLAPGRYPIWVVNPGGERMRAPSILSIGQEIYLPTVYNNN